MTEITIDTGDANTQRLWSAVGDLVDRLPGSWVLIGGLMVQLHAIEHGVADVRPTRDIDVLGQARPPGALQSIHAALRDDGFELTEPDLEGYGYRYERDGLVVDMLAPDGIKPPPRLAGGITAIGVPGGSQALSRSETVTVTVDGRSFHLNRPTTGARLSHQARIAQKSLDLAGCWGVATPREPKNAQRTSFRWRGSSARIWRRAGRDCLACPPFTSARSSARGAGRRDISESAAAHPAALQVWEKPGGPSARLASV